MMKQIYCAPEYQVIVCERPDILTLSSDLQAEQSGLSFDWNEFC